MQAALRFRFGPAPLSPAYPGRVSSPGFPASRPADPGRLPHRHLPATAARKSLHSPPPRASYTMARISALVNSKRPATEQASASGTRRLLSAGTGYTSPSLSASVSPHGCSEWLLRMVAPKKKRSSSPLRKNGAARPARYQSGNPMPRTLPRQLLLHGDKDFAAYDTLPGSF